MVFFLAFDNFVKNFFVSPVTKGTHYQHGRNVKRLSVQNDRQSAGASAEEVENIGLNEQGRLDKRLYRLSRNRSMQLTLAVPSFLTQRIVTPKSVKCFSFFAQLLRLMAIA